MIFYGSLAMHPWAYEPGAGETHMLGKTTPLLVAQVISNWDFTGEIRSEGSQQTMTKR